MAGELQSSFWTVPAIPSKLELALFNTTLCTSCNTTGIDEICLQKEYDEDNGGPSREIVDILKLLILFFKPYL